MTVSSIQESTDFKFASMIHLFMSLALPVLKHYLLFLAGNDVSVSCLLE